MTETKKSRGKFWGWMAGAIGLISGVLGIYVFVNDEVRARVFPDLAPATKADVQEQLQLSEDRIASVVQASIATALASAEARGTEVSADEKTNYEAALTSLLASDDPTFNDAKFLALSGQSEAAANNLVTVAEQTSGEAEPLPDKNRAELLRSAGDILVPSDPVKALAAYKKAQQLEPDNPILNTRIQQLEAATAAQNAVAAIPNAKFELDGLLFEFEGCETEQVLKCVLSVTNSTPQTVDFWVRSVWALDEQSRWMEDKDINVRASDHYGWSIPSLEASQIDISFSKPANILQVLRMNLYVNDVSYNKEFRDLAVRGGRNVDVRALRPVDEAHPEYAVTISDVEFHFLGCSNPDAPICRFDLKNTGTKDAVVNVRDSEAYDNQGIWFESVEPDLDISGNNRSEVPAGVTTGWDVKFRKPAQYFQAFRAWFDVDGQTYSRTYRDLPLGDGPVPEIKTFEPSLAVSPDGFFEAHGLQFAFRGCRSPASPVCVTDVYNPTDKDIRIGVSDAKGMVNGEEVRSSTKVIEMTGRNTATIPAGLTTSLVNKFRTETPAFDSLTVSFSVGSQGAGGTFTNVTVQ